jgi:protocatechuate 3,4-dioxygenase beta subunit
VVAAGETLRDVDFALVRGGVITGKITDAEGQPLIDEYVTVAPVDPSHSENQVFPFNNNQTDDRGVYRAFGLRPGKYKVSVGRSGSGLPDGGAQTYRQTFYPSVTEVEKATVIEVSEGSETDDVDIVLSRPIATFTVSGRVIDAETGAPVTTFGLGIQQSDANGSTSTSSGERFNKDGKFKLDGVRPGKYTVFIVPPAGSEWRSDALTFEVVDKDLSGLEVKMNKGAAISGVVVLMDLPLRSWPTSACSQSFRDAHRCLVEYTLWRLVRMELLRLTEFPPARCTFLLVLHVRFQPPTSR